MILRRTKRTFLRRGGCLVCCLWLAGCGDTEESDDDASDASTPSSMQAASNTNTTTGTTNAGSGGSNSGSSTTIGNTSATTAGGGSGGGASSTGAGGASTGGAAGADGSTATGGSTAAGGTAGSGGGPNDCASPYDGPIGGPREDGPDMVAYVCDQLTDQEILARYKDLDAKVPRGLYWEPPGILSWWGDACSESPADTLDRANEQPIGDVEAQVSSDWSYEVSGCYDGSRRVYSDLRCDYFDGTTLAGNSAEDLAFLASLLWWVDNGNLTGAQILGYASMIGGATDLILMCSIRTSFGDFGLCDQITLEQTMHGITVAGEVSLGEPDTVRTIQGDCN